MSARRGPCATSAGHMLFADAPPRAPPAHLHSVDGEVHQPERDYGDRSCDIDVATGDPLAVGEQDTARNDAERANYHWEGASEP